MTGTHKLDLLNNSISYFREAVAYAQHETLETKHWKFAIVHVVQAMELAFKERLRRIHPTFIYENIDRGDRTVTLRAALARLRNPKIGNMPISDAEANKIEKAFELRNQLTHFEFDHLREHIELKFAEIFSFMIFFYRLHLSLDTSEFIDEDQHARIIKLVRARAELMARALEYMKSRGHLTVWCCPSCVEDMFVVEEQQCCFCHHKESIVECPSCGTESFESDLEDISDEFEYSMDEGVMRLENDYGMERVACPECVGRMREKIEDLRREHYYDHLAMEEYYASEPRRG
ncbi:hypothetical protein H8B02_30905 [Bradyrhizobium sp. Pear77]|uniref:hypothetical protein n=1 Tax=Bradyrhizobium altum TaxID=1571202 RepID=UPI001E478AB6|nr:hypothetical protein [Bradyrhizobium altum]MCC8957681.1 hypothetical protein [Bradyrhizobium altum]